MLAPRRHHPFLDSNNRIAFLSMQAFAGLNRRRVVPHDDAGPVVEAVAGGEMDEDVFAGVGSPGWWRSHWIDLLRTAGRPP